MRVCMQMFYGREEASPLQFGGFHHIDKRCHQCLLHGQQHFQGMCKVFVIWIYYREALIFYREVPKHYREVLNHYRKVLNHYRELPVEGCYGRGKFLMRI
jgi:hypothetical protein